MPTVPGVLGPIDTADLGFTLMHEHILIANPAMRKAFPDWIDPEAHVEKATAEVLAAKERGVRTIVDLTPINLGRDLEIIRAVAERAEMQVIAATGLYWAEEPWLAAWPADALVDWLLRDLTDGIEGTNVRAGIIKCATDHLGVTEINEKLLQVAARLHRKSGAPISTHTSVEHEVGPKQQDVFEREGVDLSRVVIGHCGDTQDMAHLESILARGSFIGMDRFGIDMILPTKQRVDTIAELCRRGYAGQMVLSHDACCHIDWFPGIDMAAVAPRWNFRHISDDVVPALREAGVSEDDLTQMTVGNPQKIFEQQGAY
ncbi:MAG: phosphotriesterase [Deltaproteobacteria bacterium]|nr:phosphotriesterase [Deltaproteobacteria bacterium]MBW2445402.1 phosphotriesterase [Deltaproteobacteria bacterium]